MNVDWDYAENVYGFDLPTGNSGNPGNLPQKKCVECSKQLRNGRIADRCRSCWRAVRNRGKAAAIKRSRIGMRLQKTRKAVAVIMRMRGLDAPPKFDQWTGERR